ncbi:hypothetical protein bcgnr5378_05520 [Bacillus cereus]|uniref:Restriction endonuclease n=1 Tax=Bacillus cereus TaxID=1396 RepID=A0A164LCK7_BACCE|nr:hypothetical protein [Bacillus cereus]KZD55669.1 hypothetical protein B4088_5414 [Bacillus cereus]
MFRAVFDDVNEYIKERVTTLTGADLFALKSEFYEVCNEYMGHTKDLTGITELLVNMYLVNFFENKGMPYRIMRNYPRRGKNGHYNELDVAFLNEDNDIVYGFSIKREMGTAAWKHHELSSALCISLREKYGKNNIVQDLYRLDNIKRGDSGSFPSITFIFESVKGKAVDKLSGIEADIGFAHGYIVLEENNNKLWDEISNKLHL